MTSDEHSREEHAAEAAVVKALAAFRACGIAQADVYTSLRFLEAEIAAGGAEHPLDALRLGGATSLAFPATEIAAAGLRPDGRIVLTVTVMGLTGALGVLPVPYTELLQRLVRGKDLALRDFLDLFNGRLIELLYGVHAKYRLALTYRRKRRDGRTKSAEAITAVLLALLGLGMDGLRDRMGFLDERLLPLTAILARRVRAAPDIAQVLTAITGWPVKVEQFHGCWLALAQDEQSRLTAGSGGHARLGIDFVAGARVFDVAGSVVLHVGPLGYGDFMALVSGGANARALTELARFCLGPEIVFLIRAMLRADEVPPLRLGDARLGWDTWLGQPAGVAAVVFPASLF
ncbi:type VI secretion system baseplate subunit TssG [Chelatococcus sp. GCM10030263]|uniref:type VI secretion system baseplate subunit TssG n=1 Tax=Chelatococcus sp. GCM10030263 TaxID=3273387 RepID=UPI003617632D